MRNQVVRQANAEGSTIMEENQIFADHIPYGILCHVMAKQVVASSRRLLQANKTRFGSFEAGEKREKSSWY